MKNSKRVMVLLLSLFLISALVLTGCDSKPAESAETKETAATAETADAEKPSAETDGEVHEVRIATVVSTGHPWIDLANRIKEVAEEKSEGRLKVSVYEGGQLGNDETTIDNMRMGSLDMVIGGSQNLAPFVPEVQVFGLSYLFNDRDAFESILNADSKVFARMEEYYAEKNLGLKLLALSGGGVRNVSNSEGPIEKPEDLKGMKMRITASPMESTLWSELGVLPQSMSFNDVYSAVQTNVVNAFESTISAYESSKLYEVAPYHSRTEHQYMVSHVTMSERRFDALPEDLQKILSDAAWEAADYCVELTNELEEKLLKQLTDDYKVQINDVDKQPFVDILLPLHDTMAEELKATDLLEFCREANK